MIYNSLIISLICIGFYQSTKFGNILYFIQKFALRLPTLFGKPICLCLTCMASFHTIVWHIILFECSWYIVPTICIVGALNHIFGLILSHYE
jgi:hypothetical protein